MRYAYCLILLVCWLSACESNLSISIPYETKPVLSTLMNKDSTIFVRVTLSTRVAGSGGNFPQPEAAVELFEDGQFKETMVRHREVSGLYFYTSTAKMQLGHTYKVSASVPGYPAAEGTDVIPDTVAVGSLKHIEVPKADPFYADHRVIVQLKDKAGEKNYYRIRIFFAGYVPVGGGVWVLRRADQSEYFKTDDPDLNPFGSKERNDFFIDDALFDGKEPFFSFSLVQPFATQGNDMIIAEISNLTYDTYRYLQTAHEAEVKRGDPLVEKILIHNNIKGGYGIVGGAAIREYIITK